MSVPPNQMPQQGPSPEQIAAMKEQQAQMIADLQEEINREKADPELLEEIELGKQAESTNLAEKMDDQERAAIAIKLLELIEDDDESRSDWKDKNEDYLKLAVQVKEDKSFPWQGASNVKFPLLTTAAMQFQSRCYKTLISGSRLVRTRVIGNDRLGLKSARAARISEHMSYQLLEQIPDWEEFMDTLCLVVPICGNAFKKSYYDGQEIRSDLVLPQDLIVNYFSTSIESARRKTHIMPLSVNDIITNIRSGFYRDIDIDKLIGAKATIPLDDDNPFIEGQGVQPPSDVTDKDTPILVYECHCWWDFDEDGYEEPYIITIIKDTQEVVRITPRFSSKNVVFNDRNEIVRITPIELFTNYRFVPDPRSGVYALGFGHILGPINEATNTLINQMIDSGTLGNLPSGWLARGARMQSGVSTFKPGEWKVLNTMGDDLRKSIITLPVKETSPVLFQLLGLFIEAGRQLASVTDLMQGESPGQNQPFSTTSAVMEQGMAVYSTIFKRMHRAFKRELTKIYRLNQLYLPPETYFNVIDMDTGNQQSRVVQRTDYEKDTTDVVPNSDPEQVTNFQKLADAELLMQLMATGMINPQEAVKRILEARGIHDKEALLNIPPPPLNPDIMLKEKELSIREKEVDQKSQIDAAKTESQSMRDQAASVQKMVEAQMEKLKFQFEVMKEQFNQQLEAAKLDLEKQKMQTEVLVAEKKEREAKTVKASDIEAKDKKKKAAK